MLVQLQYIDDNHYKFWEAEVSDESCNLRVRWGRIGTSGRSKVYEYGSHNIATQALSSKVAAKRKKGYQDTPTSTTEEPKKQSHPTGHRLMSDWMNL
jgi:predicted DNA-binding WGR domain protein